MRCRWLQTALLLAIIVANTDNLAAAAKKGVKSLVETVADIKVVHAFYDKSELNEF